MFARKIKSGKSSYFNIELLNHTFEVKIKIYGR